MLSPSLVTYIAAEIIPAGARVKLVSGRPNRVQLAGVSDIEIGTAILHSGKSSYAAEEGVGVALLPHGGTRTCIAASAIASGATVKRAANGKVDDSGGGDNFGLAMEDVAADGDTFEVLWLPSALATPADAAVTSAKLSDQVADQIFATTVAVANSGSPDGVAHVTGQVKDAQGNALAGRFHVSVYLGSAAYGAPSAQSGTAVAATNTRILVADTANCLFQVLTHSDGTWGIDFTSAAGAETVHAHAAVTGVFATANAAITGN